MRKSIRAITVIFGCLASQWALAENADHALQMEYQCERGVIVPATYLNTASGSTYAVLHVDGQQLLMESVISASGARYASLDAKYGQYTWDTKGNTGALYWQANSIDDAEDASSVRLLSACVSNAEMVASQQE